MSEDAPPDPRPPRLPRWLIYLVILGLYLTLRGYHSFDGDQAYRLPLLLHRQDPSALRRRPVRAGVRRVQPASRLALGPRPRDATARAVGGSLSSCSS